MTDDECPDLPDTLREVDKITEDLDHAIEDLYTWRDQCTDQGVRDVLAAVGDALSAGWATLQHARTKAADLPEPLRLAPQAKSAEDADRQAVAALGERLRVLRAVKIDPPTGEVAWLITRGGRLVDRRPTHAEALDRANVPAAAWQVAQAHAPRLDPDRAAGYL